jgi:hypothetical protein
MMLAMGLPDAANAQQVVWRPSPIEVITSNSSNDSAHWIEQASIGSPAQPMVGQRFYVRFRAQGLDPMNPRYVLMNFLPPNGVEVAADAANPVRCFYIDRDGTTGGEFTRNVYYDNTFPDAPFRVYGCPQPEFDWTDHGYLFDRRDPEVQGTSKKLWPVPVVGGYEMYIPLVATQPLDPNEEGSLFIARFETTWGLAVATLGLQVHPPTNGADLRGQLELSESARPGFTKVTAYCTNDGPRAAENVSCIFSIVPPDSEIVCTPASPVAQLGALETIACTAEFLTARRQRQLGWIRFRVRLPTPTGTETTTLHS